jgi:hypothetical protein
MKALEGGFIREWIHLRRVIRKLIKLELKLKT